MIFGVTIALQKHDAKKAAKYLLAAYRAAVRILSITESEIDSGNGGRYAVNDLLSLLCHGNKQPLLQI